MFYFKALVGSLLAGLAWVGLSLPLPNRDIFIQSNGDDLYDGGAGVDTVSYEGQIVPVLVSLAQSIGVGEGVGTDTLVNLENVRGGTAGDLLLGDDQNNRLDGLAGDDQIWGLEGNDVLVGDGSDQILEADGENDVLALDAVDRDWHGIVQFSRFGDNLRVTMIGASRTETIVVWDQFERSGSAGIETLIVNQSQPFNLETDVRIVDEPWYTCLVPFFSGDCPSRPKANSAPVIDRDTMSVPHQ